MRCKLLFLLLLSCWQTILWAQRDDIPLLRDRQDFAVRSIQELKKNGAIVLRLKTNYRKLSIMEKTLGSSKLTTAQRKRHQAIFDATIARRDAFNESLVTGFTKNFGFCPVYIMYDTSSRDLLSGVRTGIFLNAQGAIDPSIKLEQQHIFIASFKERSADFPFAVLYLQRLEENLEEPFPYYVPIRESWVNEINAPRAVKAVAQLDKKLIVFLQRAIEYQAKQKAKKTSKKS